ncbi:MAG: NAD(+)/NADH kinase [Bacillota bacterium]
MDFKNIGFIFNPCKHETMDAIPEMVRSARKKGYHCGIGRAYLDLFKDLDVVELESSKADLIVAAGGDGTILRAAAVAWERSIPILGVNFGRIGFLSEIDAADFEIALDNIAAGNFSPERRMMLEGTLQNGSIYYCLNDFLLFRHSFEGIAHINVNIDGWDASTIFCDGLIISTPTGATGYSISAGGPVISPGLEVSIITPICPHSLYARPIVCDANDELVLTMYCQGHFSVDGQLVWEFAPEDVVRIRKASHGVDFIRFAERNLYSLIREKLT